VLRTFCVHCFAELSFKANDATVDCRLGALCGCGARYCGVKCLVASSQAHKAVCEDAQLSLRDLADARFRATRKTNLTAQLMGRHVQIDLLRADMLMNAADTANVLSDAAESLRKAEVFDQALKLAQRALSCAAKGSRSEAVARRSLGNILAALSKYDEALAHYEAALNVSKKLGVHLLTAGVSVCMAGLLRKQGRLGEALAMSTGALEMYSKAPGDNVVNIAICHNNIANVFVEQDKPKEALEHYLISFDITVKKEGETPSAANCLINIGNVLSDQNKLDEAMKAYVNAQRILQKAKVEAGVAVCHHNIGSVLEKQDKFDAALEHARKAFAIYASLSFHEHADSADTRFLIGNILQLSGKFAEAIDEFENVLRIRKNVFGEMTLKVADVYEKLALCNNGLRKWREAVTFFEATLHIRTVLGAEDSSLVELKADLAAAEEQLKAERSSAAAAVHE
jgi:tetratricopeptide (TPR) repeat protein